MVPAETTIPTSALKQRDRCAWNQAYDLYVGDVYAFIFHLVRGDRSVAEDLNQETWLAAIDAIEQFCPERGELRSWLLGIARNRVALHYRRQHIRRESRPQDESMLTVADDPDSPVLPEDLLECVERRALVRASLLVLSRDCREVLMAKYVEGLSVNEIAARVGRTPKAIESLLSRARARFRSLLHSYFPTNVGGERL